MPDIYVNKFGLNIPIYDQAYAGRKQIGTLYDRETYCLIGNDGSDAFFISFLNSSGNLTLESLVNPPNNVLVECADYLYQINVQIPNGSYPNYKSFIIRNGAQVYTAGGGNWGSVAVGQRVVCKTAMAGDTNFYLKGINYVEKSDWKWHFIRLCRLQALKAELLTRPFQVLCKFKKLI